MKTAKIVSLVQSDNVGLYSISFNGEESEYQKFREKFKANAKLNKDYQQILFAIDRIIANGAFDRYFRVEGKMKDRVTALSVYSKTLRLYCLKISNEVLIIGNGGNKTTQTYQEDPELNGYVIDLQKFDELLKEAQQNGTITIRKNVITGIEEATFTL